ncbi:MAG: hypothetical protein K6F95_05720 [Selenomonas sp.]|uniref:hypothetical protein n=1 Tax=Selenomonas sp. TaxID=2053611 RepID=UPI0025ED6EEC|nr:hypothetical protein [Selenomonas sp.]MCR5757388.1 hypothetical protein [Selenomonas sp.]
MKMKKILASLMVGAMVMTTVPMINADFAATAYAAKGGAKLGGGAKSAPKAAAPKAAPKSNSDTHKSVSGSGDTYKPSKDAKSLDKNAPTAGSKSNANANTAANTQSGSRWGNALRTVGLLAGGMLLGSMLGNLFGSSMLGDIFGVIANVVMLLAVFMLIRWAWNKFRNRGKENVYASQMNHYNRSNEPIDITPRNHQPIQDIRGPQDGYDARSMADKYRNK